ncbi:MAG: DUF507 family protein [Nitrospirota bacterium]
MLLSEDKIFHLSHIVLREMMKKGYIRLKYNEEQVLSEIKKLIKSEVILDEEIEKFVRNKLLSYSKPIPEGSGEWNILFKKFFDEELKKRKRI